MTRYVTANIHDGWGNQMFIVAALLGYAEKYGHIPVFLTEPTKSKDHSKSQLRVQDFVSIPIRPELGQQPWTVLKEAPQNAFTFTELPFVEGNVYLDGYFQSAKYFPEKGFLSLVPATAELNMCLMANDWSTTFFLHIRRGDYMHPANAHHQIPLQRYLENCFPSFTTVNKQAMCFVASDDIQWCKQMLPTCFPSSSISWLFCPAEISDAETLFWMSMCGAGGICANSTFSWWAGYFVQSGLGSQKKPLYMPYPWVLPPLPEAVDLYPPWCSKITWNE